MNGLFFLWASFIVMGLVLVDIVCTDRILARGGREKNPVMRYCQKRLGSLWWAPKLGVTILILAASAFLGLAWIVVVFVIIQLAVDAYNAVILWRMSR